MRLAQRYAPRLVKYSSTAVDMAALGLTFTGPAGRRYTDSAGVLQTAGANLPRCLYDGSDRRNYVNGEPEFLLECKAATNYVLQSEGIAQSPWTNVSTPAPVDGAVSASVMGVALTELVDNDNSGEGREQLVTLPEDGVYAVSVFWKKHAASHVDGAFFWVREGGTNVRKVSGTVVADGDGLPVVSMTAGTYLGYEPFTGGVARLLFRTDSIAVSGGQAEIRLYATPFSPSTATGSAYWGGVQIELGAYPTSYIKTTSATATRTAESASIPLTAAPQHMTILMAERAIGAGEASGSVWWEVG